MKYSFTFLLLLVVSLSLTNCTTRLVDFTVISSKSNQLNPEIENSVHTSGKKSYFFGFEWNIKDALEEALNNAGPEYDLLVDGVVRSSNYWIVMELEVEGLAVSSRQMRAALGVDGFNEWLSLNNIFDPENYEIDIE